MPTKSPSPVQAHLQELTRRTGRLSTHMQNSRGMIERLQARVDACCGPEGAVRNKIDTLDAKVEEGSLASFGLITGIQRQINNINRRLDGPGAARRPVAAPSSNRDTSRSKTQQKRAVSLGERRAEETQRVKDELAKRRRAAQVESNARFFESVTLRGAQHKKTRKHKKKSKKRTKKRNSKKSRRRR
jgi:hypothetical protein